MTSVFSRLQRSRPRLRAGFLTTSDREQVVAYLRLEPRLNLQLIDLAEHVGRPTARSQSDPLLVVAWDGDEVCGVASLRPSLVLDARPDPRALEVLLPFLLPIETGLVKSLEPVVTPLWERLEEAGRRSLIDRGEIAFAVRPGALRGTPLPAGAVFRAAREEDLEPLIYAARASLREEGRPDPSSIDPGGFRRWVRGRIPQARVVEIDGEIAFVGYADVQRADGWLVQGVFTWPERRRRGLAGAGMTQLIREGFEAGCEHVQLAVVEGNDAAVGLYRGLGLTPFAQLRTVLFV